MKKQLVGFALILVLLILISVFIYPTLHIYMNTINDLPVKINRITGDAWILYPDGWTKVD